MSNKNEKKKKNDNKTKKTKMPEKPLAGGINPNSDRPVGGILGL